MTEPEYQSESCRHAGCHNPRTRFSVFCDEHHLRQLERAGSGAAPMRPKDALRLVVGPLWLNCVRVGTAVAATFALDLGSAVGVIVAVGTASAVVGWRWSRRAIWRPDLGYPIVHIPSAQFMVPVGLYSIVLMGLVGAAAFAAARLVG